MARVDSSFRNNVCREDIEKDVKEVTDGEKADFVRMRKVPQVVRIKGEGFYRIEGRVGVDTGEDSKAVSKRGRVDL